MYDFEQAILRYNGGYLEENIFRDEQSRDMPCSVAVSKLRLLYVIGLRGAVQFGNNWMIKIRRTVKFVRILRVKNQR